MPDEYCPYIGMDTQYTMRRETRRGRGPTPPFRV